MSLRESWLWLGIGAAIWATATAALATFGGPIFEAGPLVYGLAVGAICAGFVAVYIALARWRDIAPADRTRAASCIALPGMLGEVPVLLTFPTLVPSFGSASAGAYGAFLFCGYAALFITALWWQEMPR